MKENQNLLKELCIELRQVGCILNRSSSNSSLPKHIIDHISNIKIIAKRIETKKVSIENRLAILSKETGWTMSKLFNTCLEFPKKTPKITDIKTLENKSVMPKKNKEILKYFGNPEECNYSKVYIHGNEIKLFLIDDYGQKYNHKMISSINRHLDSLEKGIDAALSFIRNNGKNNMLSNIIDEYFEYCNNSFTIEAKLLAFSSTQINKEYFFENLNVKSVWVYVSNNDIEFVYDVLFWKKSLKKGISVIEDEYCIAKALELDNIDFK